MKRPGISRWRAAAVWVLTCMVGTAVITGCSLKQAGQEFVIDTVEKKAPARLSDSGADKIAQLSADLTKQESEFAQLQAELDAKSIEAQASEAALAHTQSELDQTLDLLAAARVEQENDINLLVVLVPGLLVAGVAGWTLGSRRATRRLQHGPAVSQ